MNKSSKTFAAFTMAAILAGGSLFAQDSDTKKAKKDDKPKIEFRKDHHMPHPGPMMQMNPDQTVIIGKVKSVNEKDDLLVVTNTDGKDIHVKVTPFCRTNIVPIARPNPEEMKKFIEERKAEKAAAKQDAQTNTPDEMPNPADNLPPMFAESKLSDIKKDSWVMVFTYKTDTKTVAASNIVVKQDK
ncbi:MAG: hypothetical protein K6B43_10460 [Treponema sp.]|nr:hypothetical protein [Treponema sp.]